MAKSEESVKAAKTTKKRTPSPVNLTRLAPWMLVIAGATGFLASFAYSMEEFHYLKNPSEPLACDVSPIVGCGSVVSTWQGHLAFGIPNGFIGIAAFSVIITMGVLMLAGSKFHRWIWQGLQAGVLAGTLLVLWFFFQSLVVLKHLCPYCMITWVSVLPIAWYTTLHNIQAEHIKLAESHRRIGNFAIRHHADIIVSIFLALIALVLWRFWDYFGQLV